MPIIKVTCSVCGIKLSRYRWEVAKNKTGKFYCREHNYKWREKP